MRKNKRITTGPIRGPVVYGFRIYENGALLAIGGRWLTHWSAS